MLKLDLLKDRSKAKYLKITDFLFVQWKLTLFDDICFNDIYGIGISKFCVHFLFYLIWIFNYMGLRY